MLNAPRPLLPLLTLASLCACTMVTVDTDFALEQDFNRYHSYQWHPDGVQQNASLDAMGGDIFDTRVRRVLQDTLHEKGMVKASPPDFYINYSVITEDRVSINTYNAYGGYGPGWGYYGYGPYSSPYYSPWGTGATQTTMYYYRQGQLIIDIVDAQTNKLVWRSTADSRLGQQSTPEKKMQDLRKTVAKMFERFPPGQAK